jgi:hypothetical protein
MLLRKRILPAAKQLGIQKRIRWHTFAERLQRF